MNPRFFIFTSAAIMAVAAGGVWWAGTQRAAELRRTWAAAETRRAASEAAEQRAREKLAAMEQARTAAQAKLEARLRSTATAAPSSTATKESPPPTRATYRSPFALVHNDPEVQALWFLSRRSALRATYGPLFRTMNLSAEQVAAFLEIAIRREQQNLDLTGTMWAQGLSKQDPTLVRLEAQVKADYEAAIAELFGPAGFQQWREFELSLPIRKITTALAGIAAMRDVPLTLEQGEQLTRLLIEHSWRYIRSGASDPQTVDWSKVDARAAAFLTAQQLELFQRVEPEDGYNLYMFRFGSQVASLVNRAKRITSGLPEVSAPPAAPSAN